MTGHTAELERRSLFVQGSTIPQMEVYLHRCFPTPAKIEMYQMTSAGTTNPKDYARILFESSEAMVSSLELCQVSQKCLNKHACEVGQQVLPCWS